MGQLTAAAKQEYQKSNAAAHLVLEVDLPGGTLRWGRESLVSPLGLVDGRVRSFGEWPLGEVALGVIAEQYAQVVVEDEDGKLRDMLAGASANGVYRAAVRLKLVPRRLSAAVDTVKLATGVIHDIYRDGRRSYTIVIRPNDYALRSDFPEATITGAQWPLAMKDAYAQSCPVVYGFQVALSSVYAGQIPLICVDTSAAPNARWLICMGRVLGVTNVYINGTLASAATYAFSYVTRSGVDFSTVLFSSAAPATDATVTADVDAYDAVGDGSGARILDAVACIRHLLNNFILGRWKSGNWLGDHALLSTAAFDAAAQFTLAHPQWPTAFYWTTAKVFRGPQRKGTDALAEWLESLGFGAYWTRSGQLGIAPVDSHRVATIYPADSLELDTDTTEPRFGPGLDAYMTRMSAQYAYQEAAGQYRLALEVRNPRLSDTIEEAMQLTWSETTRAYEMTSQILSRRLLARMNHQEIVDFTAPLWLLDLDVNGELGLIDPSGLEAEWGRKKWQRRLHRIQRMSLLGDTMQVRLTARGLRWSVVNLWETTQPAKSALSNPPLEEANTLALLTGGQTRTYTRSGDAWVVDGGDGLVALVIGTSPLYDRAGHIIERAATNYVTRSSFVSALTGWVTANTTADTADLLFKSGVSGNSAKLLSTGAAHATIQHTTAAASQVVRLSIDYKNDTAAVAIGFTLTRSSDGKYWRESDSTWQVGATTNNLPLVATRDPDSRFVSKLIDLGAAGLTATLVITTTAFSQTAHVYHVQVESSSWASSRVVTNGGTVTRSTAAYTYSNNTGKRIVSVDRGTIHFAGFIPDWTGGESLISHVLFLIDHGASDRARLLWDGPNQRWALEITRGGVTVSALYTTPPVRGAAYAIAVRWISSEGELDLNPYRWSLHFDGVEVASVIASGTITEAATSAFDILHSGGTGVGDGSYRHLLISPFAYSDAEIARLPL